MTISEHARKCAVQLYERQISTELSPDVELLIKKHMDAAIAEAVKPTLRLLRGQPSLNDIREEIARLKTLIGEK